MCTVNPARVLQEEKSIGSLGPGMEADISILQLRSGKWVLPDSSQENLEITEQLIPVMSVRNGSVIKAEPMLVPMSVD
jgi:dihydroorotase